MTQLPDPIYLPDSNEPANVFTWGKPPEQTKSDLEAGVARLGGIRAPDYGHSYLLAADTLLRTAQQERTLDHHGLPIFYLQRHAAELMIKAPLRLGIEVQEYRKKLGHPHSGFPDKKQARRAERCHDLSDLLADLNAMSSALQISSVPDPLRLAVGEIRVIEKQQDTWSRYPYHKSPAGSAQWHLRRECTIPLGKIQGLLQAASDALGVIWPEVDGSIMSNLGGLYEPLLREADERFSE